MAVVGVTLQVIGMALILMGGFRAAREIGAVERWWSRTRAWFRPLWDSGVALWRRYVLREGRPVVVETKAAGLGVVSGKANIVIGEPDWDSMDQDEKLALLRKRLDGLRGLVDRNRELLDGRLDDVNARIEEFQSAVEERFGGHDVRFEDILRFELAGGALTLVGTVVVLFA